MSLSFADYQTVEAALPPAALVEALRSGFKRGCEMPPRHRHIWGRTTEADAALVMMPAWQTDGVAGVKLASIVPGNAQRGTPPVQSIYVLFDATTGRPTKIMDGRAITLNRTAAASALASTYLSRPDAKNLVVMGTGSMAPYLVRAHCAVRPIAQIAIWGRDPEKARRTAASLANDKVRVVATEKPDEAVAHADIVSCATLADQPILHGAWVRPGTHVDLVGSFTPKMREADDDLIRKARIYVDKRDACLTEPGDITQPIASGVISEKDVLGDLFGLTRGEVAGRKSAQDITLFKSVGLALEDLIAAQLAVETIDRGGS